MSLKIVGSAPAQGARAVLCRMVFGKDAVEFAVVDLHSWTVDEQGTYIANIFDSELGFPVTLEEYASNYGGLSVASAILESKNTILGAADMDTLERIVRRRQVKFDKYAQSDSAKLYREKVKTMYQQYATRNPGASHVSSPQA